MGADITTILLEGKSAAGHFETDLANGAIRVLRERRENVKVVFVITCFPERARTGCQFIGKHKDIAEMFIKNISEALAKTYEEIVARMKQPDSDGA